MKTNMMTGITKTISRTKFKTMKRSPEICIVAGVVGVVAAGVLACKATTKYSAIREEQKKQIEETDTYVEENGYSDEYTKEDQEKDQRIIYIQTGVKIIKLYAPSVALGLASLTAIVASHLILRKRNVALAAAYSAISNSFKGYRSRVVDKFGEEIERELRYNMIDTPAEEIVVDKNGKEKTKKTTVKTPSLSDTYSDYAKFFDSSCSGWTKDSDLNMTFLKQQQCYANNRLKLRGYLFLNEVYDMLGIPNTVAGQSVGWVFDEKYPNGDNYVDFGIYSGNNESARRFVNGYEPTILLDFNVDGPILNEVGFAAV